MFHFLSYQRFKILLTLQASAFDSPVHSQSGLRFTVIMLQWVVHSLRNQLALLVYGNGTMVWWILPFSFGNLSSTACKFVQRSCYCVYHKQAMKHPGYCCLEVFIPQNIFLYLHFPFLRKGEKKYFLHLLLLEHLSLAEPEIRTWMM